MRIEHNAGPHPHHLDAQSLRRPRLFFPLHADLGKEVVYRARWVRFKYFVAARTVVAHRRTRNQEFRLAGELRQSP